MSVKRQDRLDLRSDHLAATRARVLRAARILFARDGYSATTTAALAEEAGVAVQTLYSAFGSKAGIARAVIEDVVMGSGIRETMGTAVGELDGERALRQVAAAATRLYSSMVMVLRLLGAESVADVLVTCDTWRLQDMRDLAASPAIVSGFPDPAAAEAAVLAAWATTGVETYQRLVAGAGWSSERFERWLGDLLIAHLLPARTPAPRARLPEP